MLIGVGLPTRGSHVTGQLLGEWARRADQGPYSSLAVTDRVVSIGKESLIALAVAAGTTRRIRLMTSALLVPTRESTLLARQVATLDSLSGGRVSLGVVVGIREDDYRATGIDFHRRGQRLDAQLPMLRRIWAGEPLIEASGRIGPEPLSAHGPELLIGGYLPVVARRIAAWGDGFLSPDGGDPARMQELYGLVHEAWTDAGRPGRPRWVTGSYYALGPDAEEQATAYVEVNYGFNPDLARRVRAGIPTTPSGLREAIQRRTDLGVDEYILRPCTEQLDSLEALTAVVAPLAS
jgi:alkanesulfonate monooxygenase SsuD/methylene tetrahydromethanopterin reductase-like flavin-dependent oxidoreductase (luciferase family)